MKKLIATLAIVLSLSACTFLATFKNPDGSINVQVLLQDAQYGIDADCALGINPDVCIFGTDAINLAKDKSPAEVKQILTDAEVKFPVIAPYVQFVIDVVQ